MSRPAVAPPICLSEAELAALSDSDLAKYYWQIAVPSRLFNSPKKANEWAERYADMMALWYAEANRRIPQCLYTLVGVRFRYRYVQESGVITGWVADMPYSGQDEEGILTWTALYEGTDGLMGPFDREESLHEISTGHREDCPDHTMAGVEPAPRHDFRGETVCCHGPATIMTLEGPGVGSGWRLPWVEDLDKPVVWRRTRPGDQLLLFEARTA